MHVLRSLFRSVDLHDRPWGQVLAGVTLAAISIPEVLGFARIAGMPVQSGIVTMIVPAVLFVAFSSSRHLVVGADSTTAAVLAAGLVGVAAPGTEPYVQLAGVVALVTGGLLLVARLARLGFVADFLSRTLLVGFLTGVGIRVASGQLPDVLGVPVATDGPLRTLLEVLGHLTSATPADVALSTATILVVDVGPRLARKVPWALLVVVVTIIIAWWVGPSIATVDDVPSGLPLPIWPSVPSEHLRMVTELALTIAVVVLAQSAATARADADRYRERDDVDDDIVGLGMANLAAGLSGAFVVNGSPTRTAIVDTAGGRNQLAQLTAAGCALVVLLVAAPALTHIPTAVLASIVLVIALHLVDISAIGDVFRRRRIEGIVVIATAATVVIFGVGPGIVFAMVLSVIVHLRHSYRPSTRLLARDGDRWRMSRVQHAREAEPGLAIYFVPTNLYYANATGVADEVMGLVDAADPPLRWLCVFAIAIDDVDLTASDVIRRLHDDLAERGVTLVLSAVEPRVREEFERDGLIDLIGAEHCGYADLDDVVAAYRRSS